MLGFDPSAITREQFHQATELADLIWEDPALQVELRRFVKDYVKAQHAIEITEFSGAAAFEVLFTILLAAVTAGTGLAASAASQARHFAKFRKVGQLLMEFGEQVKKARKLRKRSTRGNQKASFEDFENLGEVEVSKPADAGPSARKDKPKHTDAELKAVGEAGDVPNTEFRVAKHGDMPSPRPGQHSHHGVMSAWMKKHFPGYDPNQAPAVLMPEPNHRATFGVYNKWRAEMRKQMGGKFDWAKVSEKEMRSLSEKLFDAVKVPSDTRQQYWDWYNRMKGTLTK